MSDGKRTFRLVLIHIVPLSQRPNALTGRRKDSDEGNGHLAGEGGERDVESWTNENLSSNVIGGGKVPFNSSGSDGDRHLILLILFFPAESDITHPMVQRNLYCLSAVKKTPKRQYTSFVSVSHI